MLEKTVERTLLMKVREKGGLAFKFVSPGMAGVPDRVVLLPDGKIAFVELKAPGKKPRALQRYRMRQIEDLGFRVEVLDEIEQIEPFLEELEGGKADEV